MKIIKKFESKKNKVLLVQSPDGSLFVKRFLPILSPAETNCKVCWLWTANARPRFWAAAKTLSTWNILRAVCSLTLS